MLYAAGQQVGNQDGQRKQSAERTAAAAAANFVQADPPGHELADQGTTAVARRVQRPRPSADHDRRSVPSAELYAARQDSWWVARPVPPTKSLVRGWSASARARWCRGPIRPSAPERLAPRNHRTVSGRSAVPTARPRASRYRCGYRGLPHLACARADKPSAARETYRTVSRRNRRTGLRRIRCGRS